MRESREREKRNITASTDDHGNDVEQNVNRRDGETAEEKRRYPFFHV